MAASTEFHTTWRKSSRSDDVNCVEIAFGADIAGVRDSKNQHGPHLRFPTTALDGLTAFATRGITHHD